VDRALVEHEPTQQSSVWIHDLREVGPGGFAQREWPAKAVVAKREDA